MSMFYVTVSNNFTTNIQNKGININNRHKILVYVDKTYNETNKQHRQSIQHG